MTEKRFSSILAALPAEQLLSISDDATISAPVSETAQNMQPGGIFVARKGLVSDGHDYIDKAITHGAAAVVGERALSGLSVPYAQVASAGSVLGWLAAAYHDFPSRDLIVIGVTGTDGKTTTSTILHSILKPAFGYISTLSADLGDHTEDTGLHVTTPGAPQIQSYLARMVKNGLRGCILEMTSHGLAQGRLNGVDVDVAVVTNVTHEHLDYHGSFEAYRDAKAILFRLLATSKRKGTQPKTSVINFDDPSAAYFQSIPADRTVTFGLAPEATYHAKNVAYRPDGTTFDVYHNADHLENFSSKLVGEFNVRNNLAAITVACAIEGVSIDQVKQGVAAVGQISGRMERIDEGQDFIAIVDFAHTPNALEQALSAARKMLPAGCRLITVFGSAGLRDVEKRRLMAETSARMADFTVLTAEDPRTESLDAILEMMAAGCRSQGGVEGETFVRIPDRGEAIYAACQMARAGDIVMACGKGHEQSMCFGVVEHPWDDREAMRAALRGEPLRTLPTARTGKDS